MFLIFFFLSKKVILWDINTEANESVVQEIKARGGSVSAYTCDLSNSDDVYQTAAKVGFISQMSETCTCTSFTPASTLNISIYLNHNNYVYCSFIVMHLNTDIFPVYMHMYMYM